MGKIVLYTLTGCYLFLWGGGVGSHLLWGGTQGDTEWAAPVFLVLAALIVLWTVDPVNRAPLVVVGILGFTAELIGVHSGFPFGDYEYTSTLQPQLTGVPLVMAAAWVVLVAYVNAMLTNFQLPTGLSILVAGLWMTAIDLVIDPLAVGKLGYWTWKDTGDYYGIPAQNFGGWIITSWLIIGMVNLFHRRRWPPSPWARAIGLSIVLFFTFIALAHQLLMVVGIGLGLCLIHVVAETHINRVKNARLPVKTRCGLLGEEGPEDVRLRLDHRRQS